MENEWFSMPNMMDLEQIPLPVRLLPEGMPDYAHSITKHLAKCPCHPHLPREATPGQRTSDPWIAYRPVVVKVASCSWETRVPTLRACEGPRPRSQRSLTSQWVKELWQVSKNLKESGPFPIQSHLTRSWWWGKSLLVAPEKRKQLPRAACIGFCWSAWWFQPKFYPKLMVTWDHMIHMFEATNQSFIFPMQIQWLAWFALP
jgi:hypothetical protein